MPTNPTPPCVFESILGAINERFRRSAARSLGVGYNESTKEYYVVLKIGRNRRVYPWKA